MVKCHESALRTYAEFETQNGGLSTGHQQMVINTCSMTTALFRAINTASVVLPSPEVYGPRKMFHSSQSMLRTPRPTTCQKVESILFWGSFRICGELSDDELSLKDNATLQPWEPLPVLYSTEGRALFLSLRTTAFHVLSAAGRRRLL